MLKKLFAVTALATLAVFAAPTAASALTYVPSDSPSPKTTGAVVLPDEEYVGSTEEAYEGYVGLASTGYDVSVLALSGGSAALLLGLAFVTTNVVRKQRAQG